MLSVPVMTSFWLLREKTVATVNIVDVEPKVKVNFNPVLTNVTSSMP